MKNENTSKLKLNGKRVDHPIYGDCWQCGSKFLNVGYTLRIGNTSDMVLVQEIFDEGVIVSQWIKDTKMIDLRTAKVGDEYINTGGSIVTMVMMSDNEHQFVGKVGQSLSLYNKEGKNHDDSCNDLVSKHDTRHWLKDLPDADIFADDVNHIASNCDSLWYWYTGESRERGNCFVANTGDVERLRGIKMPKLTGDEWKLSKISIPDLKAWQEQQVK